MSDGELHVLYEHQDPPEGDGRGVDGSFTLSYDISNYTDGGEVQVSSRVSGCVCQVESERLVALIIIVILYKGGGAKFM